LNKCVTRAKKLAMRGAVTSAGESWWRDVRETAAGRSRVGVGSAIGSEIGM